MSDHPDVERIALRIRTAFEDRDLGLLATVLAEDVRWGGDEDAETTCHSRAEVLAWYGRLRAQGVRAHVMELDVLPGAAVLGLDLIWPPGMDEQPGRVYQVFRIVDDRVVDIRGCPDHAEALALASAPTP